MERVLVTEEMADDGLMLLQRTHEVVHDPELWRKRGELLRAAAGADALIVRNRTRVDRDLLSAALRLRVVGRLGVGLDNIDVEELRRRGVALVVPRGLNAVAVAEYVIGSVLLLLRSFSQADAHVRAGGWNRQAFAGTELYGKTLGVVGLGATGIRVALRARAFGMRVLGHDPRLRPGSLECEELSVEGVGLTRLLEESDVVSLHCPLTPATRHLIDERALAHMRPHAILVNTARGAVIDEHALLQALQERRLGGAVLDVREVEPPPSPDPLASLPNVLLTPHVAGITREADTRVALYVAQGVAAVLDGKGGDLL